LGGAISIHRMSYHFEASIVRATPELTRSSLGDTRVESVVTLPLREEWSVVFLRSDSDTPDDQQAFARTQAALLKSGFRVLTVCWNDQVGIRHAVIHTPDDDKPRSADLKDGFAHVGLPREMQIHELISIVCHGADVTPFGLLSAGQRQKRFTHVLETLEAWITSGALGSGAQHHFATPASYQATRKYLRIQFQAWRQDLSVFTPEQLPQAISRSITEHMTRADCDDFIRHTVTADLDSYFTRMYAEDLHEHQ